ncbi:MAG: adenosylcobinamide-phosphate synthase CbiB [Prevotellaceae bacterium]|nr:adenosylcobinamide-phosphate synthase CbiB [Prevotellaceae bacterium]
MEGSLIFLSLPAASLLLGWLLDLLLGDPRWLPHPVVGFGKWIALWERLLNRGRHRLLKGATLAVFSILLAYVLGLALIFFLQPYHYLSLVVQAVVVFYCLAGCTLRREVKAVFTALSVSLEAGRRQVGRIVGRDTADLNEQEIRTAALETLAENLSDGVIAPLFYATLLGVPGMLAYKMVNTLDSMIGYRTQRYNLFGRAAARIDDVANFIPARLTALLMTLLGWLYTIGSGRSFLSHCQSVIHNGRKHLSPNAGYPEAALASLLDCQFGGTHTYFGEPCPKPLIGSNPRELTLKDLTFSLRLCLTVELVAVVICCIILK